MLKDWRVAFELARATYPLVNVEMSGFFRHLECLGYEAQLPLFTSQVYLCYSCATGAPGASRCFEREYGDILRKTISRLCVHESLREDMLQCAFEKFLVGPAPTLLKYAGSSPLEAWLGLATRRVVLDCVRRGSYRAPREVHAAVNDNAGQDTELELSRLECETLLGRALGEVLAEMSTEQRELLSLRFLSGLGTDALATRRGVHRATIVRWVEQSLRRVRAGLQKRLALSAALSESELRGVVARMDGKSEVVPSWL